MLITYLNRVNDLTSFNVILLSCCFAALFTQLFIPDNETI